MYAKLAINNGKRSIKDYLIYFITITLCVSLFYAFMSLSSSSYEFITEDSYNFEMLKIMLKYATYVVTGLLIVLISYVNKYMIKRRQKEFATYILLGAEQKNVALMFFIETLIMGVISIVIGIFIGTLLSQVVTALVLITAKQEIVFSFRLYLDTVMITFIFFIAMFFIIGFFNIGTLKKIKLIDMINAEKKTEIQFKKGKIIYILLFIISCVSYVVCGYCAYNVLKMIGNPVIVSDNEKAALIVGLMTFLVVGLVTFVLATYSLFYSISYIIVMIKNRCIGFKYEYTNLFLIGSIVGKIKTAPMLMGTTAITFLGASLSFTLTLLLSQWSLGYLEYRIPYDIIISSEYVALKDINDIPKTDYNTLRLNLEKQDYGVKEYCEVEKYFLKEEDFYIRDEKQMPILAIGLSDFNKLRDMAGYEKISLKEDEFTLQCAKMASDSNIKKYTKENNVIDIVGEKLKINNQGYYIDSLGQYIFNYYTDMLIVLPDKYCGRLTLASTDFVVNNNNKISYNQADNLEFEYIPKWIENANSDLLKKYDNNEYVLDSIATTRIKVAELSEILNATLAMRILGIYLGIVLLMISLTVLALQQLSDSIEHKSRFNTLRKLGIEEKEINKLIFKQILIYFLLPISIATIESIIFMCNFGTMFSEFINTYIGNKAFVFNIGISIFSIIIIYVCYFIATYYTFKRNVKS